ncbi:hypothetical protein JBE04_45275, partial [Streptomyces sp. PRKS01-29]|nr:hypothetical protein [Streptomyces sabulosicollis]
MTVLLLMASLLAVLSCLPAPRRSPDRVDSRGWLVAAAGGGVAVLAHGGWLLDTPARDDAALELDPALGWWAAALFVVVAVTAFAVGGVDRSV